MLPSNPPPLTRETFDSIMADLWDQLPAEPPNTIVTYKFTADFIRDFLTCRTRRERWKATQRYRAARRQFFQERGMTVKNRPKLSDIFNAPE